MLQRLVQHVTPELSGATSDRDATHRTVGEVSRVAGFPMAVSVGQTLVTKPPMLLGN